MMYFLGRNSFYNILSFLYFVHLKVFKFFGLFSVALSSSSPLWIFLLTVDIITHTISNMPTRKHQQVFRLSGLPWVLRSHRNYVPGQLSCSLSLAGCSVSPQIEPDNKEIVKLKAFPAAVSGGRLYNTRTHIMYQILDSMWGGWLECVISLYCR